ncbi:MAG: imidazole glycerol phosphate synthase subunit HisH [Candidatus Omnitrophota bacterium]|nr:MAG: imidazole glycerol phosphate synthase subunit HisH [Candidatus Omnitrophota bacterium]
MIVIVDYGMGNLGSVQKAAQVLGKHLQVTDSKAVIKKAKKIILPGVAHFGKTIKELKRRKLFSLIRERIKEGVPFFGICIGMQLLLEESEEAPSMRGFGIVRGKVKRFKTPGLIVPHMGWNQVKKQEVRSKKQDLFKGIKDGSYFYFANSYYCVPKDKEIISSTTHYGVEFVSSIYKDNIWGVQFHPEKSQKLGLKLLGNFLNLK